jgi:hypothetical protein
MSASVAAMTVLTGGTAVGVIKDPDCVELKKKTDEKRKELDEASSDKSIVGHDDGGGGTTVSGMKSAGGIATAHNNQKAYERCPNGMSKGASSEVRKGEETPLCPDSTYKHPAPAAQKSGHAEARLIGGLGGATGQSLTFSIDWRPKSGGRSNMPCPDCHKMLCAAKKDCDLDISLCDKQGQKHALSDEHCPATPESYIALQETMGEL